MILIALINNITLIVALSIFYNFISRKWAYGSRTHRIVSGLLFGSVAVIGMINPLVFQPGVIFDGRSIVISIAGFIGGGATALIAAGMSVAYRVWLGGPGAIMGVSVIISSAAIGIAYHYIRRQKPSAIRPFHLLAFGLIVHICMLALTMTLPSGMTIEILSKIALPVILIYPLGTLLICLVLLEQESRIRAEEALREREARYRELVENANSIILRLDPRGTVTFFNECAERIFGYTRREIIGKNAVGTIVPARDSAGNDLSVKIQALCRDPEPFASNENENVRRDGSRIWVNWTNRAVRDGQGHIVEILCVGNDITERRGLEERLQRAEKMEALGTLAGGVAHDMNNVLGVLTGYAELLQERIPQGDPLKAYADKLMTASEKGAAIIQDLLMLGRRGVTSADVVNINGIVGELFKSPLLDRINLQHPQVRFTTDLSADLLNIKGSVVHLEKTVMNLLANAAEAISGEGVVTIRTENRYLDRPVHGYERIREGDYVVLTVSDTGGGISRADIDKIFEPFYTKKKMGRSGTGLGLAIVWGTVKDHRGYIDAESVPGEGSTFTLYFPATREDLPEELKKIPVDQYLGKGESLLVVDDVAEQRDVAMSLLTRLGYRVHAVSGGAEAVEYLKTHAADLVVLDMIMDPGMDGLETYQRILDFKPGQKAIIVSGFAETDRVQEALRLGAGGYVRKPYLKEKIGMAIRAALNRAEAVQPPPAPMPAVGPGSGDESAQERRAPHPTASRGVSE
jgi:PAS domain S-box-containing protein